MPKSHAWVLGYRGTQVSSSVWRLGAWLMLLCAGCSSRNTPQVGGETHWLAVCTDDQGCGGDGLICVCGTCTRACGNDAACAGTSKAACFDPSSPLVLQRCEDRSLGSARGVCLLRCTSDSQCGHGRTCSAGACLPAPVSDAGVSDAQSGLQISDFNAIDASTSWTAAVSSPPVQLSITGADKRLVGSWLETGCDPTSTSGNWFGCRRLVIEQAASGEITGHLRFERTHDVLGPFAPASDADVGYPTEVAASQYTFLAGNPSVGVDYRMLAGRFDGTHLTFGWTTLDLWHGWCQLQRSYPWQVGSHGFYFCVPQAADAQAKVDPGKLALCSSADFQPQCVDATGSTTPCSCLTDAGDKSGNPLCSTAYCRCNSKECDADLGSGVKHVDFTLDGDHMHGTWDDWDRESFMLDRVSP